MISPWVHLFKPLSLSFDTHKDKRVLSFYGKRGRTDSLSSLLVPIYQSKHTEVFEKEIRSHEKIKSLYESVVALQLKFCLTELPVVIFNKWPKW